MIIPRTSRHEQVVAKVKGALDSRGIKSTDIFGTRSRAERSAAVSAFMNNESVKAIVLTTGTAAAGEGDAPCSGVGGGVLVGRAFRVLVAPY